MSTTIMTECWPLLIPPPAKAVLISLADNANDSGWCWPSLPYICTRTCLKRTAVINAIAWLEERGALEVQRNFGNGNSYQLHPKALAGKDWRVKRNQSVKRTSPPDGRVREADPTSPLDGPDQSVRRTLTVNNHQEPSQGKSARKAPRRKKVTEISMANLPANITPELAHELIEYRRAVVKAPLTQRAFDSLVEKLSQVPAICGVSVERAMTEMQEANWRGFEFAWLINRLNGREVKNGTHGRSDAERVADAGRRRIEEHGDAYAQGDEPFGN